VSEYSNLRKSYTSITPAHICESSGFATEPVTEDLPSVDIDFDALMQINLDTIGWIMIPNTVISYPVVQVTNNTKYLNTSFEGNHSRAGTPFVNKDNDMQVLDSNTIIYGHNMGTGRADMFSILLKYKDYEFFAANRYIFFDTIHQQHGWWEVFAVIELNVRNTAFKYQQMQFQDEDEFMDWITKAVSLSFHETDVEILFNDRILTLSTCDRSNYGQHGRLLILAVRILNKE